MHAICVFLGLIGTLNISNKDGYLKIVGTIKNLPPGEHGMIIHDKGTVSPGCDQIGNHYNPTHDQHGLPIDEHHHLGDLGNIRADKNQQAQVELSHPDLRLSKGKYGIMGRSIAIYKKRDDGDVKSEGHLGRPLACCKIEKAEHSRHRAE